MARKYRFEVTYSNKALQDVCNFMNNVDVNISGLCIKEIVIFTAKKNMPIDKYKELLENAYKSADCKVWMLEGGEISW
jgi:hypothetical protein